MMGTVKSIYEATDWTNSNQPKYKAAAVDCDNGQKVTVQPNGLKTGDRVNVEYRRAYYEVTEKLIF